MNDIALNSNNKLMGIAREPRRHFWSEKATFYSQKNERIDFTKFQFNFEIQDNGKTREPHQTSEGTDSTKHKIQNDVEEFLNTKRASPEVSVAYIFEARKSVAMSVPGRNLIFQRTIDFSRWPHFINDRMELINSIYLFNYHIIDSGQIRESHQMSEGTGSFKQ